jgi:hypothetical protein
MHEASFRVGITTEIGIWASRSRVWSSTALRHLLFIDHPHYRLPRPQPAHILTVVRCASVQER